MAYMSQENVKEGESTRFIEQQTAKVPSLGYLGFAVASMALSASFAFIFKKRDIANFVGLWAPSILVIGVYNKLVKLESELSQPHSLGQGQNSYGAATGSYGGASSFAESR